MNEPPLLHLFSSNMRPQYEQDILDVLAAPIGSIHLFRYDASVVAEDTRQQWGNLANTKAIINYSLQQEAHYFDPIFVPVRLATVRRPQIEGDAFFIEFQLGHWIALANPPRDENGRPLLHVPVTEYREYLVRKNIPHPYGASAALGFDITTDQESPLEQAGPPKDVELFERTTLYLQRTSSFHESRFVRFLRLIPEGGSETDAIEAGSDGVFEVKSGETYELEVFHRQPGGISSTQSFDVSADGTLVETIGRSGFDVASDYDRVAIPLHVLELKTYETRETVVSIDPHEPAHGPRMRLRLRLVPPRGKMVATTGMTLTGLSVVGTASLLPISTTWRAIVAVAAGVFLASLNVLGWLVSGVQAVNLDFMKSSKPGG